MSSPGRFRRDTGLVWGFVAIACEGTVLVTWLNQEAATRGAMFGRAGSVGLLALSVFATAVSAVTSFAATLCRGAVPIAARLTLGWLTAVLGVAVAVVAVGVVLNAENSVEWTLALIVFVGAAATEVVAVHVGHSRPVQAGRS